MANIFKDENVKKNFIFQGGILAISGILVRIIGLIYRIPMNNIIGPEGAGVYSVAFNVYNIVLILSSYGMPMAVSKMLSARLQKNEYKNAAAIFKRAIIISVITGGIAAIVLFAGAGAIENAFYSAYTGMRIPLRILAVTTFIVAILGTIRGFFQAQGSMTQTAISQIVEQIVNAIVSIIASLIFVNIFIGNPLEGSYGAAGGTLGTCIGAAAALAVIIFFLLKSLPAFRAGIRADKSTHIVEAASTYKYIIITLLPIMLGQVCYNISSMLDDILYNKISLSYLSADLIKSVTGNYGSSFGTLTSIPMGIASAMAASLLPTVVKKFTSGDDRGVRKKLKHITKVTMMVVIPITIGLVVLGQPIVALIYPRFDSVQAGIMLKIGAVSIIFYTLATVTSTTLQGIDRMRVPVIHYAIALAAHIPVVAIGIFISKGSIYAVVVGVVVFSAIVFILNMRSLKRYIGYRQEITKTFIVPLICACIMGIISLLIYELFYKLIHHNFPALFIAVVVALIIYLGTLMFAKNRGYY